MPSSTMADWEVRSWPLEMVVAQQLDDDAVVIMPEFYYAVCT